jgi:hypothetical protein
VRGAPALILWFLQQAAHRLDAVLFLLLLEAELEQAGVGRQVGQLAQLSAVVQVALPYCLHQHLRHLDGCQRTRREARQRLDLLEVRQRPQQPRGLGHDKVGV